MTERALKLPLKLVVCHDELKNVNQEGLLAYEHKHVYTLSPEIQGGGGGIRYNPPFYR